METYEDLKAGHEAAMARACPGSKANGLPLPPPARGTPVNGGHSRIRVPSGGVRGKGQPHAEPQALRDSAQSEKRGRISGFIRCVLHIVRPELEPSTTHKNAPTPRHFSAAICT
jgi:hypothetical protein